MLKRDVFVCYSSDDKAVADALVHFLEESKVKCWIAPRDVPGGSDEAQLSESAICGSKLFVVLFSEFAQQSSRCKREVNLAVAEGKIVLPVRIDDIALSGAMHLYLNDKHWIDAIPEPPVHFSRIANVIARLLRGRGSELKTESFENPPQKLSPLRFWLRRLRLVAGGLAVELGFNASVMFLALESCSKSHVRNGAVVLGVLLMVAGGLLVREKRRQSLSFWAFHPLRWIATFGRVYSGAALVALGLAFLVLPIDFLLNETGGSLGYKLSIWIGMSGVCWAAMKAGLAMLERDWGKFRFSPRKVLKWALVIFVPVVFALIGVGIDGRAAERKRQMELGRRLEETKRQIEELKQDARVMFAPTDEDDQEVPGGAKNRLRLRLK